MTRGTRSRKRSKNKAARGGANGGASGDNRGIVLALAGFTAVAILVIAAFAVLTTTGSENEENFTPSTEGLIPVGSEAPEFTAETIDGGSVSAGGANTGPTLLMFFWSDCPACNEEAPIVADLESRYEDLNVVTIGIDQRDEPEDIRGFVENYGIESPAVYEPSVGETYNVSAYPTIYVIDGQGEIVGANIGLTPEGVLEGWVEEALG